MIRSFRHRGLQRFFEHSELRGIQVAHAKRLARMLDRLDAAKDARDMDLPGYDFHELKGNRKGTYAARVSGNWRLTFEFDEDGARNVGLEDYH